MRNALRVLVLLVLTFGVVMLLARYVGTSGILSINDSGYNVLRWFHVVMAVAVVGLYEAVMARRKRAGAVGNRQVGMAGRVVLTTALVIGIYLLLDNAFNLLTGDAFRAVVWVHALFGLSAIALTEIAFSRRRAA